MMVSLTPPLPVTQEDVLIQSMATVFRCRPCPCTPHHRILNCCIRDGPSSWKMETSVPEAAQKLVFADIPYSQRHQTPATFLAAQAGHQPVLDHAELEAKRQTGADKEGQATATVVDAQDDSVYEATPKTEREIVTVDVAVNKPLTWKSARRILLNPLT